MNNALTHFNYYTEKLATIKIDQGISYKVTRLSKASLSDPSVQGEKSMTYSPVSCSRPTLLLTTVS